MSTEFVRLNAAYEQWQQAGSTLHAALVSVMSDNTSPALGDLGALSQSLDIAYRDMQALTNSIAQGKAAAPFDWITTR